MAGALLFLRVRLRPLRTSWLIVGIATKSFRRVNNNSNSKEQSGYGKRHKNTPIATRITKRDREYDGTGHNDVTNDCCVSIPAQNPNGN
jgi:hypothetical protein